MHLLTQYRVQLPNIALTTLLLSICSTAVAEYTLEELQERSADCASREGHESYPEDALPVLWGDMDIVFECTSFPAKRGEKFSIYVVIDPTGEVSQAVVTPESEASKCMEEIARSRQFPEPPFENYVLGLDLTL